MKKLLLLVCLLLSLPFGCASGPSKAAHSNTPAVASAGLHVSVNINVTTQPPAPTAIVAKPPSKVVAPVNVAPPREIATASLGRGPPNGGLIDAHPINAATYKRNTSLSITAASGAQQAFLRFGAGFFRIGASGNTDPTSPTQKAALENALLVPLKSSVRRIFTDPNGQIASQGSTPNVTTITSQLFTTGKYAAAVNAGTTAWIAVQGSIPSYDRSGGTITGNGTGPASSDGVSDYAIIQAQYCTALWANGFHITHIEILNEPNSGPVKTIPSALWPQLVINTRAALDAAGFGVNTATPIYILAPSSANCDAAGTNSFGAILTAIAANPTAWAIFAGASGHSYDNDIDEAGKALLTANGRTIPFWETESDSWVDTDQINELPSDPLNGACHVGRFINDLNHGASIWMPFGDWVAPARGNDSVIGYADSMGANPTALQGFYYYQSLMDVIDAGWTARTCSSSVNTPISNYIWKLGHVAKMYSTIGKNSTDSTWSGGVVNMTSNYWADTGGILTALLTSYGLNGGTVPTLTGEVASVASYMAGVGGDTTYDLTITVTELSGSGTKTFNTWSQTASGAKTSRGTVTMTNGVMTLTNVLPLELVTYREVVTPPPPANNSVSGSGAGPLRRRDNRGGRGPSQKARAVAKNNYSFSG